MRCSVSAVTPGVSSTTSPTTPTRISTGTTTTSSSCRSRDSRPRSRRALVQVSDLYVWPLYSLMGLRWQTLGDLQSFLAALRQDRPQGLRPAGPGSACSGGRRSSSAGRSSLPLLVYPWWAVAATYVGLTMVTSVVMATTFQLAHCVEEASFVAPADLSPARACGRSTRSRRPSTSAPATSSSPGPWAASTTRSSIISSRGSPHALSHDRADRRAQLQALRRALHGPAVASTRAPLTFPPPSPAGPRGPPGRTRNGLILDRQNSAVRDRQEPAPARTPHRQTGQNK